MNEPVLDELWRDVVSLASVFLTAVGFLCTIILAVKAKRAAVLAKEATQEVAAEMKSLVHKHEIETAHRFLNDAKLHVQHKDWKLASVRLGDLAKAIAKINLLDSDEWASIIRDAREWADKCENMSDGRRKTFPTTKWREFLARVEGEIDRFHGPFQKAKLDGES